MLLLLNYVHVVAIKIKTLRISIFVKWECPSCGTHHRIEILTQSLNLRNEALRLTVGTTGIALTKYSLDRSEVRRNLPDFYKWERFK